MQFSCESCKASLQIADEKVRGKRLIVRCKRCGAKITISDPLLSAPRPALKPAPAPVPASAPASDDEHDSDTDSTRAMDSDLLEKVLQASKRDDGTSGAMQPVQVAVSPSMPRVAARPPLPPVEAGITPRDPPVWFAMLGGKQAGPLSRAELGLKSAQGQLGPRTYIWKEGMGSWQRAKDVGELSAMFAPTPEPRATTAQPSPPGAHGQGAPEFSAQDFGELEPGGKTGEAAAVLRKGAPAPAAAVKKSLAPPVPTPVHDRTSVEDLPPGERVHQESVASELFSPDPGDSGEHPREQSAVDLARWASSELGRHRPSGPDVPRVARSDSFGGVPDAPGLQSPSQKDRTADILADAGLRKNRAPLVAAVVVAILLGLAALAWALSRGGGESAASARGDAAAGEPAAAGPPRAAPLGGTGDKSVDGLAAARGAEAPSAPEKAAAAAVPVRPAARKPEGNGGTLTDEQQAAMKSLDNERGIGTQGPKGETAQAPSVAKVDSGLTAENVRKKLDEHKGALQGCIDEALRRDPNLRVGKIHISTTIAPSGTVTAARVDKRTVDESPLGGCLKRATRRIVFPAFAGEAFDVDIPIVVTAGE